MCTPFKRGLVDPHMRFPQSTLYICVMLMFSATLPVCELTCGFVLKKEPEVSAAKFSYEKPFVFFQDIPILIV